MKKEGTGFPSNSPESSNKEIKLQVPELEIILDSTNTIIWTIDKNYRLTYSNSAYQKECKNIFKRVIHPGENSLPDELGQDIKIEWKAYYDRVLSGEKFSIERKRKYSIDTKWSAYHFGPLFNKNGTCTGASIVAHDITDRVNAKNALINSNRRFEELVDMLPDAIFEMDTNYKLTYLNKYGLELFGYTKDDISGGLNGLEMLTEEYREEANQNLIKRLKGENHGTLEYKGLRKDGSAFPILLHANSVFENGKLKGVRGLIIDISNQKKNQARQNQLAMMLDFAPSSIIVHDFDGNFLYANQKTFDLHGYSREEFMSLSLNKIDSLESAASIPSRMKLIRENSEASFQVEHIKKDGSELPLEVYALLTEWNGKHAILSVGTDITMRKQDEKILRESEEKFKNIFNNSVVGISVTDIDGKLNINKSFSQIVGYSENELNNSTWEDITHPEDIDTNKEILRSIVDGKRKTARWEKRYIHKKGHIVWADISTTLHRNNEGTPQYYITSIVDITDRKIAENEIKKKNDFIEKLISSSSLSTWVSDENGTAIIVNKACLDFFGATEEAVIGKYNIFKDSELIRQGLIPEFEKVFKEGVSNNLVVDYNFAAVDHVDSPEGTHKIINTIITPIVDTNGKVTNIIVQTIDLTDIKRTEEKILASESYLKETQKIANLGTYTMDILSGFWESSEVLDNIFGINEKFSKNVEGWITILHPDWKESMQDYLLNEVFIQKGKFDKEYKIVRVNDQKERWVHGLGRLEFDNSGKPIKMIGTIRDITEEKSIREELTNAKTRAEETEIQLLSILENSPIGFAINSISTGKVTYMNKAFSEIYHIPYELCKDINTFIDYVYGDQPEIGKKIIEDVESGDPERMKWNKIPVTDKVTKKVHYVSAANIILKDLDITISSAWDLTSQVESEEKLKSALNKAKESDRLKSAFLANMSHEIRTPMNGILGFASLLKEPQLSGEEQKKYIDIIEKSGERMLNTINDIIDISKIESGQMEISYAEFNITELFENILSFFKPEADKKGIHLSLANKLIDEDNVVKSDKEKINAILTNLVKNAIKFCDKGLIEIGCERDHNFIKFHVKDTGKGIPKERLDAIFDRFVQADIEDKEAKEGSGLGLSIAKSYVELMGGKIWVESKKDIGSTFFFTIPFMQADPMGDKKSNLKDTVEDKIENLNILIAEDDKVSELLTKLMIEKISDKILIAKTGVEAIELCKNNSDLDLILMDIKMPVLDGYEATRKIREFNKEIIIIATTAFALSGDREKALNAGCNEYLPKPLSQKELDEVLKIYFKV